MVRLEPMEGLLGGSGVVVGVFGAQAELKIVQERLVHPPVMPQCARFQFPAQLPGSLAAEANHLDRCRGVIAPCGLRPRSAQGPGKGGG